MVTLCIKEKPLKVTAAELIEQSKNYITSLGIEISTLPRTNYRRFIRVYAEQYRLDERELKKLADHLDIKWFPPDSSIPHSYVPSICFEYDGIKYTNPDDSQEFTLFCSSKSIFGVECVLKHTKNGYQDPSYFTHFVPLLADVWSNYQNALKPVSFSAQTPLKKRDDILRNLQERYINSPLNREYKNGMSLTKHQVIHLFFNQYLPGIEGICPICFKLSLPLKGFGASWESRKEQHSEVIYQEIRLSVPKLNSSYDSHKILYVTHELRSFNDTLHINFEGIHYIPRKDWKGEIIESQLSFNQNPKLQKFDVLSKSITEKPERAPSVHIPYDIYSNYYLRIIQKFPHISKQEFQICQCPK